MSEKREKISEAIVDFANALEAACVQLKRYIGEAHGIELPWDPAKIKWVKAEGAKGPYQRYPAQGEKPEATSDYKNMLAAIKQQNVIRDGYFYWVFQDKATVGRKLKKGRGEAASAGESPKEQEEAPTEVPREPEAPKEEATPQAGEKTVETVQTFFPKELADQLTFEETDNYIVIKPRQYLGSETFKKIYDIINSAGGEWISAGKESRFRVKKTESSP